MKLSRNPIFLLIFLMISISLTSASINYDTQSQTYIIDTIWPTWIGGNGQSQVHLIENTEKCLINCHFTIEFQNEEPVSLLEGLEFKDRNGNNVIDKIQNLNFQIGTYQNITTTTPVYETQCTDIYNETNQTTSQQCEQVFIQNQTQTHEELIWQDYNGEDVDGLNYLRATATKSPMTSVDWIITFRGEELGEWAWWDGSWNYKRQLSNLTGDISALQTITYDAHMNANFSDLRFVDYATESIELNYTIETKSDSNWALVRINNLGASSVYMYYGNAGASDNSNASNVYFNPVSMYYLDENNLSDIVGTNDFSNTGTTNTTGYILSGRNYDGTGNSLIASSSVQTGDFTGVIWFKSSDGANTQDRVICLNADTAKGLCIASRSQYGNELRILQEGVSWDTDNQTTSTNYFDGNWHLGILTWDGTTTRMYIDLTSEGTMLGNGNVGTHLVIGANYGYTDAWNGDLDEVRIYDRVLTTAEMEALFNETQPSFITGSEQQNSGSIAVDFVTPPTPTNNSEVTNFTVQVNATYTNSSLTNITYDFYNINGTLTTFLYPNETYTFNGSILPEGAYDYNVTICGNETINNSVVCGSTETRRILLDISPPVFNGTSPMGTYDYLRVNQTLDVNWTVIDEGVGLDSCWFIYNSIRYDVNCTDNHSVIYYVEDVNNLTGYANDTLGQTVNVTLNWSYRVLDINTSYSDPTTESTPNTITQKAKVPAGASGAILDYNGTNYTTSSSYTSGIYTFTSTIIAPPVESNQNITFRFFINTGGGNYTAMRENNQTIQAINFTNCTSGNVILNMSMYDEEFRTQMIGDIEVDARLMSILTNEVIQNATLAQNSTYLAICLDPISAISNFYLNSEIRYSAQDYASEFYYMQNATLSEIPINISLFDLNLNDSTEFLLRYQGETLTKVEGAIIQLQRKYISSGAWEVVEAPITSSIGTAVVHVDLNTRDYRAIVVKDGQILDIFTTIVFDCENELSGQCSQNLYANVNPYNSVDGETLEDFAYSIEDTGSSLITTFSIPSGTSKSINIATAQQDRFGHTYTCNQTLITSSGSIECTYNKTIGDSLLTLTISTDGEMRRQKQYIVREDDDINWGGLNWLILFGLIISLGMMSQSSAEWMVINGVITFVICGAIWLIKGMDVVIGIQGLIWLLVAAVILLLELTKQEDR